MRKKSIRLQVMGNVCLSYNWKTLSSLGQQAFCDHKNWPAVTQNGTPRRTNFTGSVLRGMGLSRGARQHSIGRHEKTASLMTTLHSVHWSIPFLHYFLFFYQFLTPPCVSRSYLRACPWDLPGDVGSAMRQYTLRNFSFFVPNSILIPKDIPLCLGCGLLLSSAF